MRIGYKVLDVVPSRVVSSYLDEFATSPACLGTTVCEARERLFGIYKRMLEGLVKWMSGSRVRVGNV